jgi:hypothetical protein
VAIYDSVDDPAFRAWIRRTERFSVAPPEGWDRFEQSADYPEWLESVFQWHNAIERGEVLFLPDKERLRDRIRLRLRRHRLRS